MPSLFTRNMTPGHKVLGAIMSGPGGRKRNRPQKFPLPSLHRRFQKRRVVNLARYGTMTLSARSIAARPPQEPSRVIKYIVWSWTVRHKGVIRTIPDFITVVHKDGPNPAIGSEKTLVDCSQTSFDPIIVLRSSMLVKSSLYEQPDYVCCGGFCFATGIHPALLSSRDHFNKRA